MMKPEQMFKREIHYFIRTSDGYRNERVVVTDPDHEAHLVKLINQECIEFNADKNNKNEFFFARYEYGKRVNWFNWKTKLYIQERLEF